MKASYIGHVEYTREEFGNPYYQAVIKYLKEKNIKTMLDVGGCVGESAKMFLEEIPTLEKVYIVEPIKTNSAFIQGRFMDEPRVEVIEKALWYGQPQIVLNVALDSVGGATVFDERSEKQLVDTITVEECPRVDFIKMDIEGAEQNIIENSYILKETKFIEVEFHHYNEALGNREVWLNSVLPHRIIMEQGGGRFLLEL